MRVRYKNNNLCKFVKRLIDREQNTFSKTARWTYNHMQERDTEKNEERDTRNIVPETATDAFWIHCVLTSAGRWQSVTSISSCGLTVE